MCRLKTTLKVWLLLECSHFQLLFKYSALFSLRLSIAQDFEITLTTATSNNHNMLIIEKKIFIHTYKIDYIKMHIVLYIHIKRIKELEQCPK